MAVRKTVVLCGKAWLARKVLDWYLDRPEEYEVIRVVPVVPKEDWYDCDLVEYAGSKGIPVEPSGDIEGIPGLYEGDRQYADILQLVFYKKIVRQRTIERFGIGLNIHLSELPKYRGARGINWALKNQERFQGVTIHKVTAGLDQGPIIAQSRFTIYPYFEEVGDVYNRALEHAYLLFCHTLPVLDRIEMVDQDESRATYYSSKDFSRLGERLTFTKEASLAGQGRGR